MNIAQLRTFIAVARTGNITRAAKFLHLSQPAVSGQIRALEAELGAALFERTASGVSLTKFGEDLLPDADLISSTAKGILSRAKSVKEHVSGKLRVATIVNPEFLHLGAFMRGMRERFPLVNIELQHGLSGQALDGVLRGEVSVGFYIGDTPEPSLVAIQLKKVPYVVAGPASWKERIDAATIEDIASLPWIATPKAGSRYHLVKKLFAGRHLAPASVVEANSESTIISLISAGVGVALVREDAARSREHRGRLVIWDKIKHEADLLFIYHASRANEPAVRAAVGMIKEVVAEAAA